MRPWWHPQYVAVNAHGIQGEPIIEAVKCGRTDLESPVVGSSLWRSVRRLASVMTMAAPANTKRDEDCRIHSQVGPGLGVLAGWRFRAAADICAGRPATLKGQAPQLVFLQCNGICSSALL
jgi:hypothetical protein